MTKTWDVSPGAALRVGAGFRLADVDARSTPGWSHGKDHAVEAMRERGERMSELQEMLHAHGTTDSASRSVLLVLQGMDTAGKGGIMRHVIGMVDPQGVKHRGFGVPTEEERAHHYLWRIRNALPPAGKIGVFDRSHYEDVLVVRVHEMVPREQWERRYDEINEFEAEVAASGTTIVKCALVVSPEEQLERLSERLDRPDKHWKYNPRDLDERARWDDYAEAYQAVFDRTSTETAPWHAVPADRKWYARLAITELLTSALEGLDLDWPPAHFDVAAEKARIEALKDR